MCQLKMPKKPEIKYDLADDNWGGTIVDDINVGN